MAGRAQQQKVFAPAWMVTFGDMMSLLLCFFVILVSLSEIKQDKFETVVRSFQEYFGKTPLTYRTPGDERGDVYDKVSTARSSEGVRAYFGQRDISTVGANVAVSAIKRGELITLGGKLGFGRGAVQLPPQGVAVLRRLSKVLQTRLRIVEVIGHAGAAEGEDMYELSWQRARAVAAELHKGGLPMEQMKLIGAGPFDTTGLDEEGPRATPQRVEVIVSEVLYNPSKVR